MGTFRSIIHRRARRWGVRLAVAPLLVLAAACSGSSRPKGPVTLVFAAYSAPETAYEKTILPAFRRYWNETTGQDVIFEASYGGSESQVCAILNGLEPDVVALSHEGDVANLSRLGLIAHDWRSRPHGGMVTNSVVVLAVRPGNPRGLQDCRTSRARASRS